MEMLEISFSCIFSAAQYLIGIMGLDPMHKAPTFRGLGEVIGRQHWVLNDLADFVESIYNNLGE